MPERSRSSRVSRAFGRLLRRLTIGLGALTLVVYYFGGRILEAWPYPACSEWPISSLANARGDVAEIAVRGCVLGLFNRQYRLRVRPPGGSPAKVVVRFDPKGTPALRWLDVDHLQAILGTVRSLTPQIAQAGPVHITFIYSGANPSLDLGAGHNLAHTSAIAQGYAMGHSSDWYKYWARGRPWIKSGWEDGRAGYWKSK